HADRFARAVHGAVLAERVGAAGSRRHHPRRGAAEPARYATELHDGNSHDAEPRFDPSGRASDLQRPALARRRTRFLYGAAQPRAERSVARAADADLAAQLAPLSR